MVSSYVWLRSMPKISAFGILASSAFRSQRLGIKSSVASLSVSNSKDQMPRKLTEREMKMRELVHMKPMDHWDKCWEEGVTPWDLGQVTPIISHLLHEGLLPHGRALVPGCGAGYDVLALANPNRYVVGLDISENAVKKAREVSEHVGGPPYAVSIPGYEEVLHPVGFEAISIENNKLAIEKRKGREMLGRWKRKGLPHSLL